MNIWENLVDELKAAGEIGGIYFESGGTDIAQKAIIHIIGKDLILSAVDHYFQGKSGIEIARSVLQLLEPEIAMDKCYEYYKKSADEDISFMAVCLMKNISNSYAIKYFSDFLNNSHENIRDVAAQTVYRHIVDYEYSPKEYSEILEVMKNHDDENVREYYHSIFEYLNSEE